MKLSYNTINSELMRIKCLVNKAIKEEIIELSDNPLKNYKIAYKKSTIVYLNEEEFLTLAEMKIKNNSNTDLYRDLFVFSCDCGGLRSKDLINLKYINFDGDYLNINTNGINRKLKIPHRSKSIISKYFNENKNPTDFLFPVRERLSLDDSIESRIKLDGIVRKMNNSIKKTAIRAGIKKPITFITSRHTFATRALSKGIPVEVLQKLIGHVNIKDTYAYKNIIDLEIDKAMDKL
jgi:integrase